MVLQKESTVSRSTIEAEYRSLANAMIEVIWIQSLLHELRIPKFREPILWWDNVSTVAFSANSVFHSRLKHFGLDLYFVRERVMDRRLVANHVPSSEQVAVCLTKPLSATNFNKLRTKLTVEPPYEFHGKCQSS